MTDCVIFTLGCRLNHADTALMTGRLEKSGYRVAEKIDPANPPSLVIVNSCAVTSEAVAKTRQMVRKLRRQLPFARIAVLGCAAMMDADNLAGCGADIVRGNAFKADAPHFKAETLFTDVFKENAVSEFPFRTRSFIKVQEGCNNFCTYCIVPYLRGRERSRDYDEIIADCRHAVESGTPEIVLTGVNITTYRAGGRDFADLLHDVASLDGDFRVRIGSAEPSPGQEKLLAVMAENPKICRFLHLSLQHGSEKILQAMHRRYTPAEFADFCEKARELIPGVHIGTDVIVGFPGETEEDFAVSLDFIEKMGFANIHRFIYSPRQGTAAAALPGRVHGDVARERSGRLAAVAEKSAARFIRSQWGRELPVIFERESGGLLRGWSDNYLAVTAPSGAFPVRRIVNVPAGKNNTGQGMTADFI